MQLKLFEDYFENKLLEDLFKAYFDARRNKRNTINALAFERDFEENLFEVFDDIIAGTFEPKPSICFIVSKPVKREIFAADFRDRIVHHLIYNYIAPIFEKSFINDSYSCRKGKGTHYGIKRVDHFIRSCSLNYTRDCYILKLDIKGYFMSINRTKLFDKIESILLAKKHKIDYDLAMMAKSTVKDEALDDIDLLQDVAEFKKKFYTCGWAKYDEARVGTLKLLPPEFKHKELKDDYRAMRNMIFGEHIEFDEIINILSELEKEINSLPVS